MQPPWPPQPSQQPYGVPPQQPAQWQRSPATQSTSYTPGVVVNAIICVLSGLATLGLFGFSAFLIIFGGARPDDAKTLLAYVCLPSLASTVASGVGVAMALAGKKRASWIATGLALAAGLGTWMVYGASMVHSSSAAEDRVRAEMPSDLSANGRPCHWDSATAPTCDCPRGYTCGVVGGSGPTICHITCREVIRSRVCPRGAECSMENLCVPR